MRFVQCVNPWFSALSAERQAAESWRQTAAASLLGLPPNGLQKNGPVCLHVHEKPE
jgi:hypothetical protein